ncbi:DNA-processing protein DprA [Cryobacterium glaciale]|uniref:DNA-processing protein DprA n=2 Tax=Cryobacterium glaciale TaxID=1259145 RepID=A0A4R8UZL5_9MICO|nr:DNA-processing protein DprA [Cryobacterium glaciale]
MDSRMSVENVALYALLRDGSLKWREIRALIERAGGPDAALREHLAGYLIDEEYKRALHDARRAIAEFEAVGIHADTYLADGYPEQLRTIHDFPPVVYWKGHREIADLRSVAIVGTRKPSEGAVRFVTDLARRLAQHQVPIVSGLAYGIDVAAMTASLREGNRTIGVIGTGLNRSYPKEHAALQDEIAANHLLLSQFHPDGSASPKTFPMRNVVMSGFASLTVIAEASEKSGTRIQARAAVRHGRPLIISRAVFLQTTWGKALVDDGLDVVVVSNAAEAEEAVHRIHDRRDAGAASWAAGSLFAT